MSASGGKADSLCSLLGLPLMTQSGPQGMSAVMSAIRGKADVLVTL
jgi:hypothetical protein